MMNFMQEGKAYGNNEDEEQEHEEEEEMILIRSSEEETNYRNRSSISSSSRGGNQAFDFDKKFDDDIMDLSLNNNFRQQQQHELIGSSSRETVASMIEKEHMFDKVVTPSDVGKLNRLVIPKQHAERYFPLDSSSTEKGLLLNFEDGNGKSWRFRYSYWNSSQSYVMTKGWSRFVKEKKLDAGDIVSFRRGVGESSKDRLFIDWRRRPDAPDPTTFSQFHHLHNNYNQSNFRWGRLYSLPNAQPLSLPLHNHFQPMSYGVYNHHHNHHQHHHSHHPYQQQHRYFQQPQTPIIGYGSATTAGGALTRYQGGDGGAPFVYDSVPVNIHGKPSIAAAVVASPGKRLRLFGVNMECSPDDNQTPLLSSPGASSDHHLHHHHGRHHQYHSLSNPTTTVSSDAATTSTQEDHYSKKGKSSNLSFDLGL